MNNKEKFEFGRAMSPGLVSIFERMREDASCKLSVKQFLLRCRECLDSPVGYSVLLEALEKALACDGPCYTSEPEPLAEGEASRRLFPKAHAGNVNRLLAFAYHSPCGKALKPSTRAYVILKELILARLSPWTDRNFRAFARYLQEVLGVSDTFHICRVHPYWRHLPRSGWGGNMEHRDAPSNADKVLRFAHYVQRCICLGGTEPDERLWKPRE